MNQRLATVPVGSVQFCKRNQTKSQMSTFRNNMALKEIVNKGGELENAKMVEKTYHQTPGSARKQ